MDKRSCDSKVCHFVPFLVLENSLQDSMRVVFRRLTFFEGLPVQIGMPDLVVAVPLYDDEPGATTLVVSTLSVNNPSHFIILLVMKFM